MKLQLLLLISIIFSSCLSEPKKSDVTISNPGIQKRPSTQVEENEFLMKELIYPEAIEAPNFGDYINEPNRTIFEGIIVKVSKTDPSGGGYAEYFDRVSTQYNFEISIKLTKIENKKDNYREIGGVEKLSLLEYSSQLNNIDIKSLEALVVPGSKIRFQTFYFGYGTEQIIYLKAINH